MNKTLYIGISACMWTGDPAKNLYNGRPVLYLEKSFADYVLRRGCVAYMIGMPDTGHPSPEAMVAGIDGLMLQGGDDIWPGSYGEQPEREEWGGDRKRDHYEAGLIRACIATGKPVLGICRGHQMINVAFGGSLWQDIESQTESSVSHKNSELYSENYHQIEILEEGLLKNIYPGKVSGLVNSVHHQAVKKIAKGFTVNAVSKGDGIIESISRIRNHPDDPFCLGVQWHPEFQTEKENHLMSPWPVLDAFLEAVEQKK